MALHRSLVSYVVGSGRSRHHSANRSMIPSILSSTANPSIVCVLPINWNEALWMTNHSNGYVRTFGVAAGGGGNVVDERPQRISKRPSLARLLLWGRNNNTKSDDTSYDSSQYDGDDETIGVTVTTKATSTARSGASFVAFSDQLRQCANMTVIMQLNPLKL
jgi:hypothetical protein